MIKRKRPPNRRECYTIKMTVDGVTVHASIHPPRELGPPQEVFISGPSPGSQMDHVLHDIAIILSVAAQSGIDFADFAGGITRTPQGNAHSIVGALVDLIHRGGTELALVEEPEP